MHTHQVHLWSALPNPNPNPNPNPHPNPHPSPDQVDLWSAVFYVSEGEPNAPGFPSPHGGHMVVRAATNP